MVVETVNKKQEMFVFHVTNVKLAMTKLKPAQLTKIVELVKNAIQKPEIVLKLNVQIVKSVILELINV